jgi:hypothetical protein
MSNLLLFCKLVSKLEFLLNSAAQKKDKSNES